MQPMWTKAVVELVGDLGDEAVLAACDVMHLAAEEPAHVEYAGDGQRGQNRRDGRRSGVDGRWKGGGGRSRRDRGVRLDLFARPLPRHACLASSAVARAQGARAYQ